MVNLYSVISFLVYFALLGLIFFRASHIALGTIELFLQVAYTSQSDQTLKRQDLID